MTIKLGISGLTSAIKNVQCHYRLVNNGDTSSQM